ncbi:MAG: YbjN domain-containing protein [Acidobacteria bacterium]|nr:YbjN domain-containing protein [Acidobacteriota bacterium]
MSRIDVLRPFIEKNLAAMLELERVAPDADGEYTFPHGSAEITIRLLDEPLPLLQLSAALVSGMKKKARLLEAINEVNAAELGFRLFRFEDLLIAAWEVPADTLDARQFVDVCRRFAAAADRLDTALARKFGGKTARADTDEDAVDA